MMKRFLTDYYKNKHNNNKYKYTKIRTFKVYKD